MIHPDLDFSTGKLTSLAALHTLRSDCRDHPPFIDSLK